MIFVLDDYNAVDSSQPEYIDQPVAYAAQWRSFVLWLLQIMIHTKIILTLTKIK